MERFDSDTARAILRAHSVDKLPDSVIAVAARANVKTIKRFLDTRCQCQTLCPDDSIRQCILVKSHIGFHDGGIK